MSSRDLPEGFGAGGAPPSVHTTLSPGDRLASYVVEGPLGAGGMGEVYKARDRPADFLTSAANRFSLALSLYGAEEWAEAGSITAPLIKEQPGNSAYVGLAGAIAARMGDSASAMKQAAALSRLASEPDGTVELTRAQLEALLGQRERAVELLRDAFARGLSMSTALHRQMDRFAGSCRSMS